MEFQLVSKTHQPENGIKTIINKGSARYENTIYQSAFQIAKFNDGRSIHYDPSTGEIYTPFYFEGYGTTRHTIKNAKKGLGFSDAQKELQK